jgi:hypothetical protein
MQAYSAAEAGQEAALNVLRGNVSPSTANAKISFLKANTLATSNKLGDTSLEKRLSGWLQYSNTYPDRVPITPNYTPQNGYAYKISISDPDNSPAGTAPSKLLIKSTGMGPKGATKILEMVVRASAVDFSAPATITMRGSDSGTGLTRCGQGAQNKWCFGLGDSARKIYSGVDLAGSGTLPAFATTYADIGVATTVLAGGPTTTNPGLGKLLIDTSINPGASGANTPPSPAINPVPPSATTPSFLQSADNARAFLNELQTLAGSSRYFTSFNGAAGSIAQPAITFVDGNATVTGGAGLLVVTGDLLLHENHNFEGLILVLGNGYLSRQGGGPSTFKGAIVVARFARTWPASENGQAHPFLNAGYDTQPDQGNDVLMQYDSGAIQRALALTGLKVVHIVER